MSKKVRDMAAEYGHTIPQMRMKQPGKWLGTCSKCGMQVWYRIMPRPGDEKFYGQALKEQCDG